MNEYIIYTTLIKIMLALAPIIFISLLFFTAPYGRYTSQQWNLHVSTRSGWVFMELPAVLVISYFFLFQAEQPTTYVFFVLWQIHYIYRTFIFPFQIRNPLKPMPLVIPATAIIFNFANGYTNGYSLTVVHSYTPEWLLDPRFLLGSLFFLLGFVIHVNADNKLFAMRKLADTEYKIPYGGLFNWISCPNYLGEIIQWIGWAILTWSIAGLTFAIWTVANLIPRAISHHRWYLETFKDYPKNRKALIFGIL